MTILAFANQSGGAGKTTSVTSIAALLATKYHKRVRIIDADGQRDSSHICGYTDPDGIEDQATLNDVFAGDTSFKEATRPVQIKQTGEWREIPNMGIALDPWDWSTGHLVRETQTPGSRQSGGGSRRHFPTLRGRTPTRVAHRWRSWLDRLSAYPKDVPWTAARVINT